MQTVSNQTQTQTKTTSLVKARQMPPYDEKDGIPERYSVTCLMNVLWDGAIGRATYVSKDC